MRRRPGIGGLQISAAARDQYRLLGENVAKLRTDLMKEQLGTFRSQLEEFARKHKGLQIVEICLATRPLNGGLIDMQEICKLLRQKRKLDCEAVSEDDCLRVISYVTVDEVKRRLSWTHERAIDALDTLLDECLAMIDNGHSNGNTVIGSPVYPPSPHLGPIVDIILSFYFSLPFTFPKFQGVVTHKHKVEGGVHRIS
ncbi:hypothetical protein DITRI_Ditri14bG0133600 [Diplodiscus trichospermus]